MVSIKISEVLDIVLKESSFEVEKLKLKDIDFKAKPSNTDIHVYTDGSYKPKKRNSLGYGIIIQVGGILYCLRGSEISPTAHLNTNCEAEILAVEKAINLLDCVLDIYPKFTGSIIVHYDYTGVYDYLTDTKELLKPRMKMYRQTLEDSKSINYIVFQRVGRHPSEVFKIAHNLAYNSI